MLYIFCELFSGASLVKGIPFNPNDPELSGADIFQKLVPMEAHEASSLYSEEKAKLLRSVGSEVDEKDAELTQFLSSLSLDEEQLEVPPARLPQQLLEKCAALSIKPSCIKDLVSAMSCRFYLDSSTCMFKYVLSLQGIIYPTKVV